MSFAQKTYVLLTADPVDAVTGGKLTEARISLLNPADSAEVDTFRRLKLIGDVIERYVYRYENSHAALPFRYIVRVESVGYENSYYDLDIPPSEERHHEVIRDIGRVGLHRQLVRNLDEVVVNASRVLMVMKGDTLVYDANAFQLAEGSMLDGLIRQLPGVRLESGGRITVNGHFVSSLLVNGKDFFNGDPQVALQNLPAYMVNKVKAYQKPPDDAYLTRSPDEKAPRSDDPWVLDVALKPQYARGYIANAELAHSVCRPDPFLARLFGLRFSDKSRAAVYATGNNVNMSGSPQTDSGNWEEYMERDGRMKSAEAGAFYYTETRNRKIRYHSTLRAGMADEDLERFTSATSFLPGTDFVHTAESRERRNKRTYANWDNSFIFILAKTYLRFSPGVSYSYARNRGTHLSALGKSQPGRAGLDSVILKGSCGDGYLNLLTVLDLGRTRKWGTSGDFDTSIKLEALHMNPLSLRFRYKYNHESGCDMQHYSLLTADGRGDRRNRYDNRPVHGYEYSVMTDYPIIYISRMRKTHMLFFTYRYEQRSGSSERMLYRLDRLGGGWMPDKASIGLLPSAADLYGICTDSLNSYRRTDFYRHNSMKLRWFYRTENLDISAFFPLEVTNERLDEWRPEKSQSHFRKEVYVCPNITFKLKGLKLRFQMSHDSPPQTLMLDVLDDSNPLSVYLGNPSLKSSYRYYWSVGWSGFRQEKMCQWNLAFHMITVDNAIGQRRRFDPQTGGYTYTPWNIDGNRRLLAEWSFSRSPDKAKRWLLSTGSKAWLERSVDFAVTGTSGGFQKSVVHNLHVSPNAGVDYRHSKWHAGFKASADWERLTSAQAGFETLSQVDFLYTLTLNAPLPLDFGLNTDLNLFMRRGYSDRAMNTDEWVWNANLSRSLGKRKAWVLKLSVHDLLGQLSSVRRTLNAQGRTETVSNTLTRNIMLHVMWKFNKKPKK